MTNQRNMKGLTGIKFLGTVVITILLVGNPFGTVSGSFMYCDKETQAIKVRANDMYVFLCTPKDSGSPSDCKWFIDGTLITNHEVRTVKNHCYLYYDGPKPEQLNKTITCELKSLGIVQTQSCRMDVLYPPNITVIPDRSIIEGRDLAVTCQSDGNPVPTYNWTNPGDCNFYQTGQIITLSNISRDDAGTYTCHAWNNVAERNYQNNYWRWLEYARKDTETFTIDVLYPPTILPMANMSVIAEHSLSVTCFADGNPAPTFRWTKVGESNFSSSGAVLILSNIQIDSAGTYICHAENSMKPTGSSIATTGSDTGHITIDVLYPPTIEALPNRHISLGESLIVVCQAAGNPPPTFRWTKEGDMNFSQSGSRLTLLDTVSSSVGMYRCHAENEIGSDTEELTVDFPLTPPTKPTDFTYIPNTLTDKMVTLVWIGGYSLELLQTFAISFQDLSNGSKQINYTEEQKPTGDTPRLYIYDIEGLSADTEYIFNLLSSNMMGTTSADNTLIIKTKETPQFSSEPEEFKEEGQSAVADDISDTTIVASLLGVVLFVSLVCIAVLMVTLRRQGISPAELLKHAPEGRYENLDVPGSRS